MEAFVEDICRAVLANLFADGILLLWKWWKRNQLLENEITRGLLALPDLTVPWNKKSSIFYSCGCTSRSCGMLFFELHDSDFGLGPRRGLMDSDREASFLVTVACEVFELFFEFVL